MQPFIAKLIEHAFFQFYQSFLCRYLLPILLLDQNFISPIFSNNFNTRLWPHTSYIGRGLVVVRLRFGWGSVEVQSRFGRGLVKVRSRFGPLSLFPMNYENYTISATVEMHGLGSIYHLLQMLFLEYIPTQIIFSPQLYSLKISGFCCEI